MKSKNKKKDIKKKGSPFTSSILPAEYSSSVVISIDFTKISPTPKLYINRSIMNQLGIRINESILLLINSSLSDNNHMLILPCFPSERSALSFPFPYNNFTLKKINNSIRIACSIVLKEEEYLHSAYKRSYSSCISNMKIIHSFFNSIVALNSIMVTECKFCKSYHSYRIVRVNSNDFKSIISDKKVTDITDERSIDFYFINEDTKINFLSDSNSKTIIFSEEANIIRKAISFRGIGDIKRVKGIIVYGVSGCGKSTLVRSICNEFDRISISINPMDIVSKYTGESENKLKNIFEDAKATHSIIVIDNIEFLFGVDDQFSLRMIAMLCSLLDSLEEFEVTVIAITSAIDRIDSSLRRHGRFDYEIEIPSLNKDMRLILLNSMLKLFHHSLSEDDRNYIIAHSNGYVASDYKTLIQEATLSALKRLAIRNNEENEMILDSNNSPNFKNSLIQIRPSIMKEIIFERPSVKWSEIGGYDDVKLKLQQAIQWPLEMPEVFKSIGILPPKGVLLYGPPGCSKTMMAKAVATECSRNFFAVKGPEFFNKYVGESEKAVKELFRKARVASPSIIFFDEIDSISGHRGKGDSDNVSDRVLSQLLIEIDGIVPLQVTVLAATNRVDLIDSALLRPGRFDRLIYVDKPNYCARKAIFSISLSMIPHNDSEIDIDSLANRTVDFNGAEIVAVTRSSALIALEENINAENISKKHIEFALEEALKRKKNSFHTLFEEKFNMK